MKVVVDSGGSKTDWRLVDQGEVIESWKSAGLNPYFYSDDQIERVIQTSWPTSCDPSGVEAVCFYGAGLASGEQRQRVGAALKIQFSEAQLEVEHDLIGAARAISQNKPCIAVILGTGSNSCAFDGQKIVSQRPSLGYILADEGSGAYLGKKLLVYIWNLPPGAPMRSAFEKEFDLDFDTCIRSLYAHERPNRFLANFAPFLIKQSDEPAIRKLIDEAFTAFLDEQIAWYPQAAHWELGAVGSVAHYFEDFWRPLAEERGIRVTRVLPSPIDALTAYHTTR